MKTRQTSEKEKRRSPETINSAFN